MRPHGCIGRKHISGAAAGAADGASKGEQMASQEPTYHKYLVASMSFSPDFTSLSISSTFTSTGTCSSSIMQFIWGPFRSRSRHLPTNACTALVSVLCRRYPPALSRSGGHRAGPLRIFEPLKVKTPMDRTARGRRHTWAYIIMPRR